MKLEFSQQIFKKYTNIKFWENPSSRSKVVPHRQRVGKIQRTKLIVTFHSFVNLPNDTHILKFNTLNKTLNVWKVSTWWSTSNMAAKSKSWLSWSISCRWKKTTVLKVSLDLILGISRDVTIHWTIDTLDSRVSVKSFTVSFSSDAIIQTWFVLSEWIRKKVFHNMNNTNYEGCSIIYLPE